MLLVSVIYYNTFALLYFCLLIFFHWALICLSQCLYNLAKMCCFKTIHNYFPQAINVWLGYLSLSPLPHPPHTLFEKLKHRYFLSKVFVQLCPQKKENWFDSIQVRSSAHSMMLIHGK